MDDREARKVLERVWEGNPQGEVYLSWDELDRLAGEWRAQMLRSAPCDFWLGGEAIPGGPGEAKALRQAVPLLHRMSKLLPDAEAHTLLNLANAVEDALDGAPWPSMRPKKGGRPGLWKRRWARLSAVSYIAHVRRGNINDPGGNPVRTVSAVYGVTERAVQQWVEAAEAAGVAPKLPLPGSYFLLIIHDTHPDPV